MKNLYLKKIFHDGIEKKSKNYLIHQENYFYRSLAKQKEFTLRHYCIKFPKNIGKDNSEKSTRFFRRIISIFIVLRFWKKYSDVFMESYSKNNDVTKEELVEEIFLEEPPEDEVEMKGIIAHKVTEMFGTSCQRTDSVYSNQIIEKGNFLPFIKINYKKKREPEPEFQNQ